MKNPQETLLMMAQQHCLFFPSFAMFNREWISLMCAFTFLLISFMPCSLSTNSIPQQRTRQPLRVLRDAVFFVC